MIKRVFDILISLVFLFLALPVLILISLIPVSSIGKPIFFVQQRPGFKGELFSIIKFRTMHPANPNTGSDLDDYSRIPKIGKFLRETSLDELPELINVLKGEMSLVGPRPLLPEYLDLYSQKQNMRHDVKPGITGWAQINGRNNLSWEEKFELDVWYVKNHSLCLDVEILFKTLLYVLRRKDILPENKKGMERFKG